MTGPAAQPYKALVLAAQRGPDDPVAQACGLSHKCLAPIAGRPMLAWVLDALIACERVEEIYLSNDDPELLAADPIIGPLLDQAKITVLPSQNSPSSSVAAALETVSEPFPLLVTTGDHALLSREMLDHFLAESEVSAADVAVGLAAAPMIVAKYPDVRRTYLRFRDERYSGANLFALRTPVARQAVAFWQRVERQRKHPWRLIAAFGPLNLAAFGLRRLTLKGAMVQASRRLGLQATAITLPFAEAAIDVDKPSDLELVRSIREKSG